jgi:translation elongation factor EF-1alpha
MASLFNWLKGKKVASPKKEIEEELKEIGKVTHYFSHVKAAVIELSDNLKTGDRIVIKGHTTDFEQVVKSMQSNNVDISEAGKGKVVGIKVKDRVRQNDIVYKK